MELKDQIKKVLSFEETKNNWKNDHNSQEWNLANDVAAVIMGQGLNRRKNCGCLTDLFIMLKSISESKIKLKQLQMENEFELKPGILLFVAGTHYSNANLTDEKSIEILTKFPVKIKDFIRYPKNWKDLCVADEPKKKAPAKKAPAKTEAPKDEATKNEGKDYETELRGLNDDVKLRELCTKLAEQTEGLNKLNHKAGTEKMIEYLLKNKVNG
jgi:hypothetical protein